MGYFLPRADACVTNLVHERASSVQVQIAQLTDLLQFVYGCLYLLFEAYPIVFTMGHGFNAGISGLMLLPIPIGGAAAVVLVCFNYRPLVKSLGLTRSQYSMYYNPRYEAEAAKLAPRPVPPEFRLHMAFIAGPLFSVSFFWFGWTSFPSISYWAPLMAGLLMGFAIQLIFVSRQASLSLSHHT